MNILLKRPGPQTAAIPVALVVLAIFCMTFLVPASLRAAEALEVPQTWTLRNALVFGLQNSPDSRIALQRIVAAQISLEEAESVLYQPNLGLSASYAQTNTPLYSFGNILNQGVFSPDIDFNDPGRTDNLNLKAEIQYRLYNGGRDQAGVAAAESGYMASEASHKEIEHQLGFEIVRAFQNIIQAQNQVQARQAELEAIEGSLAVAEARFEAGDLLKTEVLNFEVQRARTSENLIIADHQLNLSEKIFLNLLGLEGGPVTIDSDSNMEQQTPNPGSYLERPEFEALSARLEAAEAELAAAQGNKRPTVDGFASYQYDYGWVNDGSGDSWTAGLRLNYNLWDANKGSAEIGRKEVHYRQIKEQLHKLKLSINLDINEAELNYQQALKRRSVTDKVVEVARESAVLSRERFKEGVILSSDLLDTEVRLTDTLVRQAAAHANYQIAVANLRRAAGYQQFQTTTEALLETQP